MSARIKGIFLCNSVPESQAAKHNRGMFSSAARFEKYKSLLGGTVQESRAAKGIIIIIIDIYIAHTLQKPLGAWKQKE